MGWLFGPKRPKVPFPEGKLLEEGALRLPARAGRGKIIEPEAIKAAAGIGRPLPFPSLKQPADEESIEEAPLFPAGVPVSGPVYVKIDIYQQILGEIDSVREKDKELAGINQKLESSEYNEETNFTMLRRAVKAMHDRLLLIDKTLFKT